jgi:ATP-binding cassette subfamily F protein uup
MDKLVDHLFVFQGNGEVKDYNGTFTEYRLAQQTENADQKQEKKPEEATRVKNVNRQKRGLSYKEKRELESLEAFIDELEQKKSKLEQKLSDGSLDFETMTQISTDLGQIIKDLEQQSDRWLELSEMDE